MTESTTRRVKTKSSKTTVSVVKPTTAASSPVEESQQTRGHRVRHSVVSDTKIKRFLDDRRFNSETNVTLAKIRQSMEDKKEVKKLLSEDELKLVNEYLSINKTKLEKETEAGSSFSANEIALRAYVGQKYKFKKELSSYIGVIADLMIEEIMTTSMEHATSINKIMVHESHIVKEQLSSKLLYPLYCNLPSFVKLSQSSDEESTEESDDSASDADNKYFIGNVSTIFNKIREDSHKELKVYKTYRQFLSNLLVEFLDRVARSLMIIVKNNSRNRVVVKSNAVSVVEMIMSDYTWEQCRYPELEEEVRSRLS